MSNRVVFILRNGARLPASMPVVPRQGEQINFPLNLWSAGLIKASSFIVEKVVHVIPEEHAENVTHIHLKEV